MYFELVFVRLYFIDLCLAAALIVDIAQYSQFAKRVWEMTLCLEDSILAGGRSDGVLLHVSLHVIAVIHSALLLFRGRLLRGLWRLLRLRLSLHFMRLCLRLLAKLVG